MRQKRDVFYYALLELVACATLRGDNELPHPADDSKMWTARMQEAWDSAHELVKGAPLDKALAASRRLERV